MNVWSLAWRVSQHRPKPFWLGVVGWAVFFAFPALIGYLTAEAFDALSGQETDRAYWIALAILVAEALRMVTIHFAVIQFSTSWVLMESLLRANLLAAQLASGGDDAGRPVASSGEAVSRFRDDPRDVAEFVDSWLDVTGGVAFAAIALVVMASVSVPATLLVLIPMVAVAVVTRALDHKIKEYRQADRAATVAVTGWLGDVLAAATTIKVNDATDDAVDELSDLVDVRRHSAVRDRVLEDGLLAFSDGSGNVALGLVLVFGAATIESGELSAADLALFVAYLGYLSFLPRMIGRMLARRKQSAVAFANMSELVADQDPVRTTAPYDLPIDQDDPIRPRIDLPERVPLARLEVVGLTARYPGGGGVDDVSFSFDGGTFTVITGPIGSGKTTLLRAVLGLAWDAEVSGSVLWNGTAIGDRAAFLVPPNAAFLPQVPQLLSDSVADNVLLGQLDRSALSAALELAAVDREVAAMADGVDTLIGPRGLRLSGGQRQRVATARALVHRPELVVLDDLSSALDVETERALWQNLAEAGITVLAVSHRKVAFEVADRMLRMERGRLVEASPLG